MGFGVYKIGDKVKTKDGYKIVKKNCAIWNFDEEDEEQKEYKTPLSEYHIDELLSEIKLRTKQYNEY